MEGHAAMDMTIPGEGGLWQRLRSRQAFTSVSHIFVMEWAAVIRDIVIGLLIAGAVAAWVPDSFWGHLFLTGHPLVSKIWGPLIGPVISLLSFVCSIGNVPLAAVLWNGGISFGGVVAFIFADLIIVPILVIYRKYYGTRMMLFILATFYATMAAAGYLVELIFGGLGLIPAGRHATVAEASIRWNYTTVLNIIFLMLAAALCLPVRPHRRHRHAQDDGRGPRRGRRASRSSCAHRALKRAGCRWWAGRECPLPFTAGGGLFAPGGGLGRPRGQPPCAVSGCKARRPRPPGSAVGHGGVIQHPHVLSERGGVRDVR